MEFSSTYGGTESLPVTGFTFQEPENDPRNFCYLWTMQGRTEVDNAAILLTLVAAFEVVVPSLDGSLCVSPALLLDVLAQQVVKSC